MGKYVTGMNGTTEAAGAAAAAAGGGPSNDQRGWSC